MLHMWLKYTYTAAENVWILVGVNNYTEMVRAEHAVIRAAIL